MERKNIKLHCSTNVTNTHSLRLNSTAQRKLLQCCRCSDPPCPVWGPLATHGYRAVETWLARLRNGSFYLNNHTWLVATATDSEGLRVGSHSGHLPSGARRGTGGAPEAARPRVPSLPAPLSRWRAGPSPAVPPSASAAAPCWLAHGQLASCSVLPPGAGRQEERDSGGLPLKVQTNYGISPGQSPVSL